MNDVGRPDPDLSEAYVATSPGGPWWSTTSRPARSPSLAPVYGSESPFFRSKFRIPDDPRHFVARPRLLGLLDDLAEYPIIAIVAPAGAGKTALAADWLRHADRPCGWLALDDADREPVQFWRSVVAVLDQLVAGDSPPGDELQRIVKALTSSATRATTTRTTTTTSTENEVDAAGTTVTLVIDDVDCLDGDDRSCAALQSLVHNRPTNLRLLLLSRRRLALPADRLRAGGQLADIHFDSLRFTDDEATRLLTSLCPSIPPSELSGAVDRAEGWAAALKLTALSIRSGHRAAAPERPPQVTGPDRLIDEYLWQEVLRGERPELIRMLLATAVVGRLNYGLTEALTGRLDAEDLLEEAEDRGLFVTRLEDGGWFQVHSLVRDMLISKYQRRWPMGLREQHARAARWFESLDEHLAAVDHWLRAERPADALRVLADGALSLVDSGRGEVIGRIIDQIPPAVVSSGPESLVRYAWCTLMVERMRFHDALSAAERALTDADALTGSRLELLRAAGASLSGDWDRCELHARHALSSLPDQGGLDPVARFGWILVALGVAVRERWHDEGDLVGQVRVALSHDAEQHVAFEATRVLGLAMAGRPLDAMRAAARLEHVGENGQFPRLRTELELADAIVAAEVGDRERARSTFMDLAGRPSYPVPSLQLVAKLELVQLLVASGQLDEALTEFGEAEGCLDGVVQPSGGTSAANASDSWQVSALSRVGANLSLATDDLDAAAEWSRRVSDPFWGPICQAKVGLARGEPAQAAEVLTRASPRCVRHEVTQQLVLARLTAGQDRQRATATAGGAAQRAAKHGLLQTVADDGTEILELIELAAWRVPDAWMGRLRHVLVPTWAPQVSGPLEPLTERERDVLRLLPSRLTLREIASELYISSNTLKFHLRAIYRKLAVDSRATAVQAARQVRLLPRG